MRVFNLPAIFTLIILLGLTACGGGGGGGGSQSNVAVTYAVDSSAGAGGSISSAQTVDEGGTASFTVTPDTGFIIDSVSGCSGSLTGNTYTTGPITADCSVTATFTERVLNAVSALFPTNGANWNDYVAGSDPTTATDTACDLVTITDCLHGGELRAVEVTDKSSCTGLTATDTLGAFNWECDDSTNPVRMISTGLADKKYLSDLIDFSGNAFKPDGVTVFDNGIQYGATPETVWWSNAIEVNNSNGSGSVIHLTAESTIYLVTNNVSAAYSIDADRIGLVIEPGITVTGELPVVGSSDVIVSDATRLWIEGQVDANTYNYNRGIRLLNSHFTRLRNVRVSHAASEGIYVGSGQLMYLRYVTATDNGYGIRLGGVNSVSTVKNAALEDALVSGNTQCGLYVTGNRNVVSRLDAIGNGNSSESANLCLETQNADLNQFFDINASHGVYYGIWLINPASGDVSGNVFNNIRVSNNGVEGIVLGTGSFSNTFTRVTVSNNRNTGILIVSTGSANNNRFADVTIANNGAGGISAGEYDFLMNVVASNNGASGIIIGANDTAFNLAVTNNATDGIYLNSADDSVFTGLLKVGNNGTADCTVNGGTNPGLTGACANAGTSDATPSFSVDAATIFVGKVTGDDAQNSSDTNGGATDAVGSAADFDWIHFENDFRAWGIDGSAFPNADHRGQWPDGSDGRIWDWSVSASDVGDGGNPALLNVLALPDGNDTFDLVGFLSTQIGLRNAIEFLGDGIGDDDGICESNETCLYTPNIGAYQGHGKLISAGAFTDGTLTGITLLRYENNGR